MRINIDMWKRRRQPYVKPQVRRFPLAANELLAKDCKKPSAPIEFEGSGRLSGSRIEIGS